MTEPSDLKASPVVNPYAPPGAVPASVATSEAPADHLEYAGFAVRGFARVIDMVVLELLAMLAGAVVALAFGLLATQGLVRHDWAARLGETAGSDFLVGFVASIAHHAICEAVGGATVGKAILGLRVRSEDGGRARLGGTVLRSLGFFIDSFFFGIVAYRTMSRSRYSQRLGDRWGHTVVVRARSLPQAARAPNPLLGIVAGCTASAMVSALDLTLKVL